MNNFERTTDNALKSMGIGVDARLKDLDCKFLRTQHGEPIFVKGEDPQSTVSVRPINWNAEQLRAMADYLDAHPDCTKCIDILEDDSPSPIIQQTFLASQGITLAPAVPSQPWGDLDDAITFEEALRKL